jgi:hypothetical protein
LHWNGHDWTAVKLPVAKDEVYGQIQGLSAFGGKQPGV